MSCHHAKVASKAKVSHYEVLFDEARKNNWAQAALELKMCDVPAESVPKRGGP